MKFWRPTAVFLGYVLLAAIATQPLLRDMGSLIISDPGDPILNTSIVVWNATTMPLSAAWWNAPHFYPTEGVVAFTENLLGMAPISTPLYWLTGNALLAHNLTIFLTWPLSAFAAYLLVRFLSHREDAAVLSGLAFGFSPYRAVAQGHLQTMATFGVALILLGMHGYLKDRRWPWLVLAGAAWLQQALANGYYVIYGALILALWFAYFCTRRDTWKPGLAIAGALAIFSAPLVPLLLKYRAIHEYYGLHRRLSEILYFSASPASWFETNPGIWLWGRVLPHGKDDMFPGVTVVVVALAGIVWLLVRRRTDGNHASRTAWLRAGLGLGVGVSFFAILFALRYGNIDTTIAGIHVKMTQITRALVVLVACGLPLVALTPRTREAIARRSPLVFYAAATIVIALLSCGPLLRVGDDVIWGSPPYAWLMPLPGFNELRVPTQLKMIDILCLAVAAGLAYPALRPSRARAATTLFAVVAFGVLLDGWMVHTEWEKAPSAWPIVEPAGRPEPILELPLGPETDFGSTLRAALHRRRVLNGVSGYDPPHYVALKAGLAAHDPATLAAIASLSAFDIVVDGDLDRDGANLRYAAAAVGSVRGATDGHHTVFHVPKGLPPPEPGATWPIADIHAVRYENDARLMRDGIMKTGWGDFPQVPDQWVIADLGEERQVGGVTNAIGDYVLDFPRHLIIEVSKDQTAWERVWEGPTFAETILAFVRSPQRAALHFVFEPRTARYVRLRQVESFRSMWRISELQVHGPG